MALGYVGALVNGVLKNVIAAFDSSGGVAAASLEVDVNGAALGTAANPKITSELPYQGVVAMTVGTAVAAQRAIRIICTTAGNVSLTYADESIDIVPVNVGLSYIAGAFTKVNTAGTTATATYANVK